MIKSKALVILGWIISLLLILGLLLKAFQLSKAALSSLSSSALLFAFGFVPIYYFLNRKTVKHFYKFKIVKVIQALAFFFLSFTNLFSLFLDYPGGGPLFYVAMGGNFLILVSLAFVRKIEIKDPIVISTFLIILLSGFVGLENKIVTGAALGGIKNQFDHFRSKNQQLEKINNQTHLSAEDSLYQYFSASQKTILSATEGIPEEIADSLIDKNHIDQLQRFYNYDTPTALLFGSYPTNWELTAATIKNRLADYLNSRDVYFPGYLKELYLLKVGEKDSVYSFNGNFKMSWETAMFHHHTLISVLTTFEVLKNFVLTQKWISDINPAAKALVLRNGFYFDARNYEKEISKGSTSLGTTHKPFRIMMASVFAMVILIFHIPKLPVTVKWKNRFLLFIVVVIFEYILLVIDYFVGVYSSTILIILGVNILLALGLVTLDYFLRNNFLKWYK